MNTLHRLALALPLTLMVAGPAAAMEYFLVRGAPWQGVLIEGVPPRGIGLICRDDSCYTLKTLIPLSNRELSRYGINGSRFEDVAEGPEVERLGENRLKLPAALGQRIYMEAYRDHLVIRGNKE